MFLNTMKFKKFLKHAYKGTGLTVGVMDNHLILTNVPNTWGAWLDMTFLPNKLKAALIELIGELPTEGEIATYTPESVQNELVLNRFDYYTKWQQARDCGTETPFILKKDGMEYVLFQIRSSMELCPLIRIYKDVISYKEIDPAIEEIPGLPAYRDGILYWKNDTMIYWAGTSILSDMIEEDVLPRLNFLDCFADIPKIRNKEEE